MRKDPDETLTARLRQGDTEALSALFTAYRERLGRGVRLRMDPRLRGRLDPEDVLQEAWLAAAQRIDHFRELSTSAFVWLRMMTMQTLVDATRHHLLTKKRDVNAEVRREGARDTTGARAPSLAGRLLSELTSPTRAAVRAELAERLDAILEDMSELDREILVLRHFEELSNKEASEVLGIHKAASTNRYLRALRRLKAVLEELPEFGDHVPS